jgi:SAM-dependent methyltransferase
MDHTQHLTGLLRPDVPFHQVEPGIYSVLPPGTSDRRYDLLAGFYDSVVGNPLYLRAIWDNSPADFRRFAAEALRGAKGGIYLDAGCGSLLFTGRLYRRHLHRPAVLVDRSLGMLRQARRRLEREGGLPPNFILLQADLLDLPFRPGRFASVMCMGLLHIFPDPQLLVAGLEAQCAPGADLFMSSLVRAGRLLGDRYLALLERSGQIAAPRTEAQLLAALGRRPRRVAVARRGNSLFIVERGQKA